MRAIIDTERASKLAKAAHVLLDEAEMMGLVYSVKVRAKKNGFQDGTVDGTCT